LTTNTSLKRIILFIFLGLIAGGALGEIFNWLLGTVIGNVTSAGVDNPPRNFFILPWFDLALGFDTPSGINIDLGLLKFKFGINLKVNTVSILALIFALYIEFKTRSN
jgi:hypothetical protein